MFVDQPCSASDVRSEAYNGSMIPVKGCVDVHVRVMYEENNLILPLIIVFAHYSGLWHTTVDAIFKNVKSVSFGLKAPPVSSLIINLKFPLFCLVYRNAISYK